MVCAALPVAASRAILASSWHSVSVTLRLPDRGAAMGALLPELFATNVRYTGSAIAYNVASILGAAVAPLLAVALWARAGGAVWPVGIYLAFLGVLTLISLIVMRETRDREMTDI